MYKPAGLYNSFSTISVFSGIISILFFSFLQKNYAQSGFKYEVFVDQYQSHHEFSKIQDSLQLIAKIQDWISDERQNGYLLAGIDSIISKSLVSVYLNKGQQFKYVRLIEIQGSDVDWKMDSKIQESKHNSSPEFWALLFDEWIQKKASFGYPFARIDFLQVMQSEDTLVAYVSLNPGPEIVFKQTDQRNKIIFKEFVLNKVTGVFPGRIYNQLLVDRMLPSLSKLSYLNIKSAPRVLFLGNEGIVWLYLEKAKANKFEILLGLSSETGLAAKKYRLTGEAGFDIQNTMKYGERIFMRYENLSENSPRLKLGFDFPYIRILPLGFSADFNLFKFGEQYLDISSQLFISYPWSRNQKTAISFGYHGSSILSPDTLSLIRTKRLPSQLDYRFLTAGLNYKFNNLEYPVNPRKGILMLLDLKVGRKEFLANNVLLSYESNDLHVQSQFDSLNQNQEQAVYNLEGSLFVPLAQRHIVLFKFSTTGILSAGKILENELIRVGGYKNLRGFDEDFYRCSNAFIQTVEYRFLLDRNSFVNIFSDFAYLKQPKDELFKWNWYEGIGIGIQFQTKVGAFSLQYAIGANKSEAFNFGNGKVHFGYSSLF
ncbi:MAG: hypothetical protein WAR77_12645 [Saprospiraceae bacterium]